MEFSALKHQSHPFILLINITMPTTIVGILTFVSRIYFMFNWVEHKKSFKTLGPGSSVYCFCQARLYFTVMNVLTIQKVLSTITLLLGFTVRSINGYSTGAPTRACGNMTPGHGYPVNTSPAPYLVEISKTQYSPNERIYGKHFYACILYMICCKREKSIFSKHWDPTVNRDY